MCLAQSSDRVVSIVVPVNNSHHHHRCSSRRVPECNHRSRHRKQDMHRMDQASPHPFQPFCRRKCDVSCFRDSLGLLIDSLCSVLGYAGDRSGCCSIACVCSPVCWRITIPCVELLIYRFCEVCFAGDTRARSNRQHRQAFASAITQNQDKSFGSINSRILSARSDG